MASIENFILKFKVEGQAAIDKASKGIENLSNEVAGFGASTGPLNNALSGILGKLGPIGLAAGAAGGAFAALGLQAVNLAAQISDIAGATGVAEGTLLNFRTSVIEAGGSADDFGQIAAKLNQNVQEAAGGNEKLQDSFRKLGVYVTDAAGNIRSTEDILRDITIRFQEGSLSGEKYSAAVDLLGKNITKLDLQKLSAIADPVKDAEIKKLDEYAAAIDRVRDGLERKLITFFGSVALEIDQAIAKSQELEREANKRGNTRLPQLGAVGPAAGVVNPFGIGAPAGERKLTAKEQEALRLSQMERLMAPAAGKSRGRTQEAIDAAAAGGGFGAPDPKRLEQEAEKARREAEQRAQAAQRAAEQLAKEKQTILDMAAGYRRASEYNLQRYDLQKQLLGATDAERSLVIGRSEIEKRYSDQIAALETKKATAKTETLAIINETIALLQSQQAAELSAFDVTQKATNEYTKQKALREALKSPGEQIAQVSLQPTQGELAGLSSIQRQILAIKDSADSAARAAAQSFTEQFGEDAVALQEISNAYSTLSQVQADFAQRNYDSARTFEAGWNEAFARFQENVTNVADQTASYFDKFTNGAADAFAKMAETGKWSFKDLKSSFKDLANSMIADFIRIQVKRAILGSITGGGSFLGSLFGKANGGNVAGGVPITVGERGPELFVPRTAGTIVPNNGFMGGNAAQSAQPTQVTYNIQAVDASSFRSLVARDPSFLYAVTEKGRQSQPRARLA